MMIDRYIPVPDETLEFKELEPSMDYRFKFSDEGQRIDVWYKDVDETEWEHTDDCYIEFMGWVLFHYRDELTLSRAKLKDAANTCNKLGYVPATYFQLTEAITQYRKEID